MRAVTTSVLVLAFAVLVSGVLLINCPFLSAGHSAPCCPREAEAPQKCPLSPNIERCPYFITETKLGYAEVKILKAPLFIVSEFQSLALPVPILEMAASDWTPSSTDLHIRIRVLLI